MVYEPKYEASTKVEFSMLKTVYRIMETYRLERQITEGIYTFVKNLDSFIL